MPFNGHYFVNIRSNCAEAYPGIMGEGLREGFSRGPTYSQCREEEDEEAALFLSSSRRDRFESTENKLKVKQLHIDLRPNHGNGLDNKQVDSPFDRWSYTCS